MRVAFIGSYIPRRCGIATFTADTVAAVRAADPAVGCAVFAIDEPGRAPRTYDSTVVGRIEQGNPNSYRQAAAAINASSADVVSVQHEFGLYGTHQGGTYHDHLRGFLETVRRPVVTTLHTVLPAPEPWMRESLRAIASLSTRTVVMVETAARILREDYGLSQGVEVIPHGMPAVGSLRAQHSKDQLGLAGRTVVSTFGLVDPRKGLEYAIEAMPLVVQHHPDALYVIIGQTHPELVRSEGEGYREKLEALVARLGLAGHVAFVNRYISQREILDYLVASDVYVTPYLDPNQITSGTLAYAMGAGKAIVSTPYLHAREALAQGRGVLVGFRNPLAIARAVNMLIEHPARRARLARAAAAFSAETAWPVIGQRVLVLMRASARLSGPRTAPTGSRSEPAATLGLAR